MRGMSVIGENLTETEGCGHPKLYTGEVGGVNPEMKILNPMQEAVMVFLHPELVLSPINPTLTVGCGNPQPQTQVRAVFLST